MWQTKKNGCFAEIAWRFLCQEGRKKPAFTSTLSFFLAQNSVTSKHNKLVVSAEIAQHQKWLLSF